MRGGRIDSGWWVILACLVCQMGLGLGGYVFAVFLKPVVHDLGWSRAAFSGAGGPLLLAIAVMSPVVGTLTERRGVRFVLTTSAVLLGVALLLLSVMQNLVHFYLLGLLLGTAITGLGDIPVGAVIVQWFRHRRGLALGLVYIGSNIGGSLVPLVATALMTRYSWRQALRVIAVLSWVLIIPFAVSMVRERAEPRHTPPDAAAGEPGEGIPLQRAVRTPTFWILLGILFTFYFYYLGVNNHLVAFLSDEGFSYEAAARRFSAAVALGIGGKILIGLLADRIPKKAAAIVNFGLMTVASVLLLFVHTPGTLPLFLLLHGLTVAAENVLLPLLVADCFGPRHMPQIYGTIMIALLPGGVLGPVFAGYIFDTTASYRVAFALFALLNVVAFLALFFLRRVAAQCGPHDRAPKM